MYHNIQTHGRCIIFIIALIFAAQTLKAQNALQRFDDRVMINFVNNRTPAQTDFLRFISNSNDYLDVGVPAFLLIDGIAGNNRQMRENAGYIASSTAISFGLTQLIKVLVKRKRPFLNNVRIVPVYRAQGYSFPSGHASSSFGTVTALSIAYPKWYIIAPSFLWAGTVSYSRMYLGEHYPTDVAAGALLGASSAYTMKFVFKPH